MALPMQDLQPMGAAQLTVQAPVKFLTHAGYKLNLSEEAICTAAYYYHKFSTVMCLKDYDINLLLMACLNLASKVCEHSTKLGDIVNVCHRHWHPDEPPLEIGDLYWQLKESVAKYELLLLRALKFDAQVQLPHSHLLHFLLAMSRWIDEEVWSTSHVTQVSWALLQDSFHTDLSLRYRPCTIATGVLYLAVECCKLDVPVASTGTSSKTLWSVLDAKASIQELENIGSEIMQVYK